MIVNDLVLGYHSTWSLPIGTNKGPQVVQNVDAVRVEGVKARAFARGSEAVTRVETIYVTATSPIAGFAAGSPEATHLLLNQFLELVGNRDLMPCFVDWELAKSGVLTQDLQNGWYIIESASPDDEFIWSAVIPVAIRAMKVAPPPPSRLGMGYTGGSLSTTYGGAAGTAAIGLPLNATPPSVGKVLRPGAEGNVPVVMSPVINPIPFAPSATPGDWFKGGCRIFDAMAPIGTNAVPLTGAYSNPSWLEVKGIEHQFVGDIVITNGLLMVVLSPGQSPGVSTYLWVGSPGWQLVNTPNVLDNVNVVFTLRDVTLQRLGLEWVTLDCTFSNGQAAVARIRMYRGEWHYFVDLAPETYANTNINAIKLVLPAHPKFLFNASQVRDVGCATDTLPSGAALTADPSYGFGGSLITSASFPFLTGILYQNPPSFSQPMLNYTDYSLGTGDAAGPGQTFYRTYGIWAIPFTNPQNLQGNASAGTLDAGWSSVADNGASNNNTAAKCVSGTVAGRADLWGTASQPQVGKYNLWVRGRVTSAAGSQAEMTVGLWDATAGAFVAGASQTYKANQMQTAWKPAAWIPVAFGITPPAGHNVQFRAVTALTLGTDYFFDEAVLLPETDPTNQEFPQDIYLQFLFDRTTRLAMA